MSLLTIKAWVKLMSEEKIEADLLQTDYAEKPEDVFLAWRKVSVRSECVKDIVQYSRDKCIVYTYEEPFEFLVKESHKDLHRKWALAKEKEGDYEKTTEEEKEVEDEDDENDI